MKLQLSVWIAAAVLVAVCGEEELNDGARLLAHKSIHNTNHYTVYNVGAGSSAASEINIADNPYNPGNFAFVSGEVSTRLYQVPPSTSVTYTIVVRPGKAGYSNFISAEMLYKSQDDAPELEIAANSEPGIAYFASHKEFDRQFSFLVQAFAAMTLPSIVIPFFS